MWWMMNLAMAGTVQPAWTARLDEVPSGDGVQLMGVDPGGEHGWLRVNLDSGAALWQVDLRRGRVDGVWQQQGSDPELAFAWGSLYPLVQSAPELHRMLLVQGHIAGLGRWSNLAVAPAGPWAAWERPTRAGGDGIGLRGPQGDRSLASDLYAAYRPRFDRAGQRVAFTGTGRPTRYRVFVEDLDGGERVEVGDMGHASWFEWDRDDALWVLSSDDTGTDGAGCLSVVRDGVAEHVACPSDATGTTLAIMDPAGELVVYGWYRGEGVATELSLVVVHTPSQAVVARHVVPTGRTLQALRSDGRLVVGTLEGSEVVDLHSGRRGALPDDLWAPVTVHFVDGCLPMLRHRMWTRDVSVVWVDPDQALRGKRPPTP